MERRKSEPLSNLLSQYLRQEGLETPLAEYRAVEAWSQVVGEPYASLTEEVVLRGQTLYVRIRSAAARQELLMKRGYVLQKLNEAAGAHILYDLRLI